MWWLRWMCIELADCCRHYLIRFATQCQRYRRYGNSEYHKVNHRETGWTQHSCSYSTLILFKISCILLFTVSSKELNITWPFISQQTVRSLQKSIRHCSDWVTGWILRIFSHCCRFLLLCSRGSARNAGFTQWNRSGSNVWSRSSINHHICGH